MTPIRVLIVDDSLTVRKRLSELLSESGEFVVVAEAHDGREAIALCMQHRPDVVTMDMALPVMSGLAATEYIMAHCPTPILIVSASFNRGDVFKTYDALAAGAVDVFEKPSGNEINDAWESALLSALRVVSRVRVITHRRARTVTPPIPAPERRVGIGTPALVAIGASTGGPSAVVNVLRAFPREARQPVLLVIHLSAAFASSFADWLDAQLDRPVRFAKDGEALTSIQGEIRLAPADAHMEVIDQALRIQRGPERHSCRPSVDVLFESIARNGAPRTVACLLTGMGRDGAAGLLALRRAGAYTIAQDEATSVVYGMPREAAALDAADRILPLPEIGPALGALCVRGPS